jgi:isopentenyldiphosphate isomerase
MSADELVAVVDENNRVVGAAPRAAMRARRLLHRAVYVLVFAADGRLYVQQRTMTKDIYPGRLDPAAGGVVLADESYEDAASRELAEEMGIEGVALTPVDEFYFEDQWSRVWGRIFECVYDGPLRLQPEEVAAVTLMHPDEALELAPDRFTPDGLIALRRVLDARAARRAGTT